MTEGLRRIRKLPVRKKQKPREKSPIPAGLGREKRREAEYERWYLRWTAYLDGTSLERTRMTQWLYRVRAGVASDACELAYNAARIDWNDSKGSQGS